MAFKEGFVEVNGGRIWYQKFTENNNTPVILLHGGPGSSHYSMQGLRALATERPVVFYDQLGCGNSDRPSDHSLWNLDRFVEELGQIREALTLDEVHILGHSWGTTLAAAYGLTKPSGVKSIIFSSPCLSAPLWAKDQDQNRKELPMEVQKILKNCEVTGTTDSEEYKKATVEFNKRFVCRIDPKPEILVEASKLANRELYHTMWGPSEFTVTGNLKDFDCTARLNEIKIPTLYTCGRYDEATPQSTSYFSSLTPESKFHVFENSAHLPYLEETEEYMQVVSEFLRTVDSQHNRDYYVKTFL